MHSHRYGKGTAVLMNLSPQWYNAYRSAGAATAKERRATFIDPVVAGGPRRWVELKGAGEQEHGYEITYWSKDGRTIVLVVMNPELAVSSTGGGNAVSLKSGIVPVALHFAAEVHDARDERTGKSLGDGAEFSFELGPKRGDRGFLCRATAAVTGCGHNNSQHGREITDVATSAQLLRSGGLDADVGNLAGEVKWGRVVADCRFRRDAD